jgi:type I restriction enzyme S subunit
VRDRLNATATGAIQQYLSRDDFRQLRLPVPPPEVQEAIADYLDTETARIDALIAKKQQLVEMLLLRHHHMVRDATSGSGPERPLRRMVSMVKTGTTPSSGVEPTDEGIEWVTPGDFSDGLLLLTTARRVQESAVQAGEVALFPAGSVLIVGIGATAGKVAFAGRPVSSNQQVTAIHPGPELDGRFLAWQLWSRGSELRDLAPYTTLPILNNDFLRSFPVRVPSLAIQREAARTVDNQWMKTRALQTRLESQVELLHERRRALITAAVTGEFEIPGVAA